MNKSSEWVFEERPGYLGKRRDEIQNKWIQIYGGNNWKIAWQWGDKIISKEEAWQLYEDGYYEYFKKNPQKLEELLDNASDVYDNSPSNVNSGFDYTAQETNSTHLQDISIRRVVARLEKKFRGTSLVEIRFGDHDNYNLNPGVIPFHMPEMIYKGEIKSYNNKLPWWQPLTIEDMYQKNKVLLVRNQIIHS